MGMFRLMVRVSVFSDWLCRSEADVDIGANTTIDRARIGKTVIGEGTKIDNLVQIGQRRLRIAF